MRRKGVGVEKAEDAGAESPAAVSTGGSATAAIGKLGILIVEDSPELCALLTGMLNEIPGVDIVGVAETERAAIDLLASQRPDLAIVDLELRAGNGLNVLAHQSRPPEATGSPASAVTTKTLVFSNYANSVIRDRCHMLGATAFFDKSFQMDELLDYIQAEASARSARQQPASARRRQE